ncbi:MAG: TonB family protein [Nitrospirota bacterium]
MNAAAQTRGEARSHVQGWTASVLFHGLAVAGAVFLLSDLRLVPKPEPFKWNVALVERPKSKPMDQPVQTQSKPAPAKRTPVAPQPVEPEPVVQTVATVETVKPVIRETAIQETREVAPVVRKTVPVTTTVAQPAQTIRTVGPSRPAMTETVTAGAPAVTQAIRAPSQPAGTTTVVEAEPAAPAVQQPVAMQTAPQVLARAETTPLPGSRLVVKEEPAPVPVARETEAAQSSPVIQEATVRALPVRPAPAAKADYGWLAQSLWDRVARIKRYPHQARARHLEGRVVVRAVIREDGHLGTVEVAESSGHTILDDDALEIIRRACPLKLRYPLGRPEVVVQVPIHYRLER